MPPSNIGPKVLLQFVLCCCLEDPSPNRQHLKNNRHNWHFFRDFDIVFWLWPELIWLFEPTLVGETHLVESCRRNHLQHSRHRTQNQTLTFSSRLFCCILVMAWIDMTFEPTSVGEPHLVESCRRNLLQHSWHRTQNHYLTLTSTAA